jgi:hypothetical protein
MPTRVTRSATLRRLTRLMAACAVVVTLWACGPVYIPVPPPMIQAAFTAETWTDGTGTEHPVWTAEGLPRASQARATFYLFDQEQGSGVIAVAAADGSFKTPPLTGTEGDHIQVYYRDARGEVSATTCLILSEARPTAGACP